MTRRNDVDIAREKILARVTERDGPTLAQIARACCMAPNAVGRHVRAMERERLLVTAATVARVRVWCVGCVPPVFPPDWARVLDVMGDDLAAKTWAAKSGISHAKINRYLTARRQQRGTT